MIKKFLDQDHYERLQAVAKKTRATGKVYPRGSNNFEYFRIRVRTFVGSSKIRFGEMVSFECVSNSSSLSSNNNSVTSEFGNFQNTNDWIECESKSFPGRTYFFNLRTTCSTWVKPVSRDTTLPRYRQRPRTYDEDSTCDLDKKLTIVSSESEDSGQSLIFKNSRNLRRSSSEILAWLYHGVDINMNNSFDDDQSRSTSSCFSGKPHVLGDKQNTCASYKKSSFHEVGDHFLVSNNHIDKIRIYNGVVQNVAPTADYLEVKLSTPNDPTDIAELKKPATYEDDDSLIVEKCIVFSSSSSEICHSPVPYDYAPRLPRIRSKYLQKEKIQKVKRRRGRLPKKKSVQNVPRIIVSELYGTKTISYDPVGSVQWDLPPGVKRSNLSDSSATSSLWREKHPVVPVNPTNFQPIDFCSHMNLSSDSTTSSSCTCSSCKSSDASQSSLSNTSKRGQK